MFYKPEPVVCPTRRAQANLSRKHLLQMVLEMADVIFDDKAERHRLAAADRAGNVELVGRNAYDDAQQVQVVGLPERDQIAPRGIGVAVALDPGFLLIAGKGVRAVELGANESLVVVGGRIDEVAEQLFARPLARGQRR